MGKYLISDQDILGGTSVIQGTRVRIGYILWPWSARRPLSATYSAIGNPKVTLLYIFQALQL